jgi:hypothetical protein
MDKWRLLGAGVIAGCCAIVLGACTGDPGPVVTDGPSGSATPTVSASPSGEPSPSSTPLTDEEILALLPPNAGEADLEGAVVTAEFFVELYGEMLQSGDTRLWDALSGPECAFCADSSATALEYAHAESVVRGGAVAVDESRTRGNLGDDGFTYVGIVVDQEPIEITTVAGDTTTSEAGQFGLAFRMAFVDGTWQVVGVDVVAPEELPS